MQKPEVDPNLIAIWLDVVREGSFSSVARNRHAAPSSISRQVSALEDQLGVRLLRRSTRKLQLTDAGAAFFERAESILGHLREACLEVSAQGNAVKGRLRITAPPTFGQRVLAPVVSAFQQRYPEVLVELNLQDRFIDVISEGYDVALRAGDPGVVGLIARKLVPNTRVLVASKSYLEKAGVPKVPQAVADHRCLLFRYVGASDVWHFRKEEAISSVRVFGHLESNCGEFIMQTVTLGQGIALLPLWVVADAIKKGDLVRLFPDYDVTPTDFDSHLIALYESRKYLPAKLKAFLEFLEESIPQIYSWEQKNE